MCVNRLTEKGSIIIAGVNISQSILEDIISNRTDVTIDEWKLRISNKEINSSGVITGRLSISDLVNVRKNELLIDTMNTQKSYMILDIINGKITLELSSTIQDDDRLLSAILMKYFIIVMILVGLSVMLATAYASHMYSPVRVIDKRSDKLIDGNLSTRISLWHSGIFRDIVDGFNQVAEKMESDYNNLLNQSMEVIKKQDELLQVNQSLESNYDDLKSTNRRIEYSKEKFRTLIENIHDLVWVIDENCEIVFVNEAFESKLGKKTS